MTEKREPLTLRVGVDREAPAMLIEINGQVFLLETLQAMELAKALATAMFDVMSIVQDKMDNGELK